MWTFLGRIAELALDAYRVLADHGMAKSAADAVVKRAAEAASRAFAAELGSLIASQLDAIGVGAEGVLAAFTPPEHPTLPVLDIDINEVP